jgi:hypothetical protein
MIARFTGSGARVGFSGKSAHVVFTI